MKEPEINPAIFTWARESAGLTIEEAADRLGFTSSTKTSAVEKLTQFEAGERTPTRSQLLKFSAVYRRPLLTFYMQEPPQKGYRGEDFRQTSSAAVSTRENALLDALLRELRARQEMVKFLLEEEEASATRLSFIGAANCDTGVTALVEQIASALNFDYKSRSLRRGGPDTLFKVLRSKAEELGIFVLLIGDLGSHHSSISADVFRGFAIADDIAPFIVINDQDARAARCFTLMHELAHLWLGQGGVSGAPDTAAPRTQHEKIERFCNDVAGEFLLPTTELGTGPPALNADDRTVAKNVVSGIAETWGISEPMVAYRLNRIGWISRDVYQNLIAEYAVRWRSIQQKMKEKAKEMEGGPSYYVVKQNKLGNALIEVVRRTLRENLLTHTKAAKVLGVKPSSVEPLIRGYEHGRGSFLQNERGQS